MADRADRLAERRVRVVAGGGSLELALPTDKSTDYVANEIFRRHCYAPVRGMAPARVILDVGANVGLAAAYFRLVHKDALIHCVEPDPFAFGFLARNAAAIGNCRVHQAGLYDVDCTKTFLAATSSALSSLARNPIARSRGIELRLRAAGAFVRELGVERFDLIKIDTEGAELPILRSLGDVVRRCPTVYLEFHSHADRLAIDELLCETHWLERGNIAAAHRGELTYVLKEAAPPHLTAATPLDGG
jgi:FkbM family methyltransferase